MTNAKIKLQTCFGCTSVISTQKLVCRSCWNLIPQTLQQELYRTWNRGNPIEGYWGVRTKCIDAVLTKALEQ